MGFDFGKNKDTMKLLTLGSVIGAAVYTGWTMIALIVISITHKAYSASLFLSFISSGWHSHNFVGGFLGNAQ